MSAEELIRFLQTLFQKATENETLTLFHDDGG